MKRFLFVLCIFAISASCNKQKGIVGEPRVFEVVSTNGSWPTASSAAISRTWQVKTGGGDKKPWTVEFMDGTQGFVLETDYPASQFTVSIDANTGSSPILGSTKLGFIVICFFVNIYLLFFPLHHQRCRFTFLNQSPHIPHIGVGMSE